MFNDKAFDKFKLNDLCVFLRNGMSIKQEKNAKGYPITRIETLSNSIFNRDRLGYANIMFLNERYLNYILEDGDILISHINSEQFVGRVVQYHKIENEQIIHGMNLLCMRVYNFVDPTYIEYYFKTEKAKKFISSITKRAINQASMASGDLKNMIIDLPPIELQNKFASFAQQIDKSKYFGGVCYGIC